MTLNKKILSSSGNMSGLSRRAILGGGAAAIMAGAVPGQACACGEDHPPVAVDGVQMDFKPRRGSLCWRYLCDVTPINGTKTALPSPWAIDLEGRNLAIDGYIIRHDDRVLLSAFQRDHPAQVPGGVAALVALETDQQINVVPGLQTIRGVFKFVPDMGDGHQLQPIYRLAEARMDPFCVRKGSFPRSI